MGMAKEESRLLFHIFFLSSNARSPAPNRARAECDAQHTRAVQPARMRGCAARVPSTRRSREQAHSNERVVATERAEACWRGRGMRRVVAASDDGPRSAAVWYHQTK